MTPHPPTTRPHELAGLEVLVVDDDPDALDLLTNVLEARQVRVHCANSVREALDCLRAESHKPDVLISDIGMPGEDGYALIRKVRSMPESEGGAIKAIALTAFNQDVDRERALLAGFSRHLSKPVDLALLCAEIHRLSCKEEHLPNPLPQLRAQTRQVHAELERLPYARRVLEGRVSRWEYGAFLQAMHLVYQGLESAMDRVTEPAVRAVFREDMRKEPWLMHDLRELELQAAPVGAMALHAEALVERFHQACDADPFFLLGALYVLEGATLGGRVQHAAMMKSPALCGLTHRYLAGYQSETRHHFEHFAERLQTALCNDSRLARAVKGAVYTFERVGKILDAIHRDDSVRIATGIVSAHGLGRAAASGR